MIRGDIQVQAETTKELAIALRVIASSIEGSCRLDGSEPESVQTYNNEDHDGIIIAEFRALPEYREGDLEKYFGADPDFTGGLSTEEYLNRVRGEGEQ